MSTNSIENKKKENSFWFNEPILLFKGNNTGDMFLISKKKSFEENMNTLTRIIIVLTILGYIFTQRLSMIFSGIVTIILIVLYYYSYNDTIKEPLENMEKKTLKQNTLTKKKKEEHEYHKISKANPMGNTLITEINEKPTRKPAPFAYDKNTKDEIYNKTKDAIKNMNSDQSDLDKKLFRDLGDNFEFENSMMQFNTNPNTTVPNDQKGFADFCYGNMISCKEGNEFACAKKDLRYINQ
jgi:hypothetical protein